MVKRPEHGLLIDYEYCTGCYSCQVACCQEYGWEAGMSGMQVFESVQKLPNDKAYVSFLPFEENVLEVYQGAYCLILPSVGEGLSNVLLEGMAMELPVIASRVSGSIEVLDQQKNGLLIAPGSSEALASAMELVLSQPDMAFELGRQARLKVQSHYSLDAVAQKYAELYESLINKKEFN